LAEKEPKKNGICPRKFTVKHQDNRLNDDAKGPDHGAEKEHKEKSEVAATDAVVKHYAVTNSLNINILTDRIHERSCCTCCSEMTLAVAGGGRSRTISNDTLSPSL